MGHKAKRVKSQEFNTEAKAARTFERVRPVSRAWLLATTGLVAGLLASAGGVNVARAAGPTCADPGAPGYDNFYVCEGSDGGPTDGQINLTPGATFAAQFVNSDPFQWTGTDPYGVLI